MLAKMKRQPPQANMLKNHTKRERRIHVCWFHSVSALTFRICVFIVIDLVRTHSPIVTRAPAHAGDDVIVHLDGRDRSEFELLPLTDLCAYQAAP